MSGIGSEVPCASPASPSASSGTSAGRIRCALGIVRVVGALAQSLQPGQVRFVGRAARCSRRRGWAAPEAPSALKSVIAILFSLELFSV